MRIIRNGMIFLHNLKIEILTTIKVIQFLKFKKKITFYLFYTKNTKKKPGKLFRIAIH